MFISSSKKICVLEFFFTFKMIGLSQSEEIFMRLKLFLIMLIGFFVLSCSNNDTVDPVDLVDEVIETACTSNPCGSADVAAVCSIDGSNQGYTCSCSEGFLDTGSTCIACSSNDGQTTVTSVAGNTLFHASGSWGARPEGSYVFDNDTSTAYFVSDIDDPSNCTNGICDDKTSIYVADQNTGVQGSPQTASGLNGNVIIFFNSFADVLSYRDDTNTLCIAD